MKKTLTMGIACVALLLGLVGCGNNVSTPASNSSSSGGTNSTSSNSKKLVIGFSQVTLQSPFYVSIENAAKAEVVAKGGQVITTDAENDIQKQNNDVQDLITKGVNALIIDPVNPQGIAPALAAAQKAKIPVIAVDRPAEGPIVTFVGRDNEKMGELAGQEAVKLLGGQGHAKGLVIEIQGAAGDKVMMARRDGFDKIVGAESGVKIIHSPYCDYIRSKAVAAMQDLIQKYPNVSLVYAHNDDMALGALQVLKQYHLDKKVKIVSIDGLTEDIKAIMDGYANATVLNDPQYEGKLAADTAIGAINGKTYPSYIDAGTTLVTSTNASKYYNPSNVFASYEPASK
ncbi:Periplasmic binding protein domain [Acididesulfobacillus acetoxydans]|uniref:D-ribose-binding protein n=1 Tax=Acididesulfobacillus acetoxydans TaxID=1561005 RepID=A0A8S0W7J6_9FIRM|nr:substrate-binding domain-containing protein [Acididesulfobacillus acetoxydans]CAA7600849.1 Periplasmic binding protein domain [Acididesulfobacillus acetoxydans]CEJ06507.1 D-ribose-binding protein [Acididesulfobacillus acetoxydans]